MSSDMQVAKVEKMETHTLKPVLMSAKVESQTPEKGSGRSQSIFRKPKIFLVGSGSSSNLHKGKDQRDATGNYYCCNYKVIQ